MVTYLTGLKVTEVMADFSTVHKTRLKPSGEVETYAGKIDKNVSATEAPINTEDVAMILFRFNNGALGSVALSQVSAGRKNFFWFEIGGSKSAIPLGAGKPERAVDRLPRPAKPDSIQGSFPLPPRGAQADRFPRRARGRVPGYLRAGVSPILWGNCYQVRCLKQGNLPPLRMATTRCCFATRSSNRLRNTAG